MSRGEGGGGGGLQAMVEGSVQERSMRRETAGQMSVKALLVMLVFLEQEEIVEEMEILV